MTVHGVAKSQTQLSDFSSFLYQVAKVLEFSFSISPINEYSGLISFRIDWLDFLAVQQTLKSFLQHHGSKESVLRCSAFFIVQFSHPYMTTGKTTALIRWTFVGKVMSLLFNMLSRLVITFLPRSKYLLISWLQSPSAVILEQKALLYTISDHVFTRVFSFFLGDIIWQFKSDTITPLSSNTTCYGLNVSVPLIL